MQGPRVAADGGRPLRIALLSYRSKPHCGGQGVYVRHLSRELANLGHQVEVLSGPPYPNLDAGVGLTHLPSLDLYRDEDPFRVPWPSEFRTWVDALEFGIMCTAGFPEPLTFSLRAYQELKTRDVLPDVIHDNQTLGYGMLLMQRAGMPIIANVHHPITVDKQLDLAASPWRKKPSKLRWYGFLAMQKRVIQRMPTLVTVSENSFVDIVRDFEVDAAKMRVIPVGVEHEVFVPPSLPRVPGRIVATASADHPLKGIVPLLEAAAKLRTERDIEVVIVGKAQEGGAAAKTIERLGLEDTVRFMTGLPEQELVDVFGSANVGVVPSLYEGFSLPAIELMSCATPLVCTTAGALPEVVGDAALTVPPGDTEALAAALKRVIDDDAFAAELGQRGRDRVMKHYTWPSVARQTAQWYRDYLGETVPHPFQED
ncbi:MAG: glycosyl transferase family 1 [Frankiales bacterium]|nr:glycosyl transferase family 1 [Frankiales bacterium]